MDQKVQRLDLLKLRWTSIRGWVRSGPAALQWLLNVEEERRSVMRKEMGQNAMASLVKTVARQSQQVAQAVDDVVPTSGRASPGDVPPPPAMPGSTSGKPTRKCNLCEQVKFRAAPSS